MEKIKLDYSNRDTVSPDRVRVNAWGIDAFCGDPEGEPFPIIYTERLLNKGINETVFISDKYGEYHSDLNKNMEHYLMTDYDVYYISSRSHDTYVRIWKKYNIMSVWSNRYEGIETIEKIIKLFKNGDYLTFSEEGILPKKENYMHKGINFNNLMFYWETYEHDENNIPSKYICRAPLSELFNSNMDVNVDDDADAKLLHLMTPQEKAQAIQNNGKLKKEREEYAKEGDRAWKAKYGNIDPAQYHLLMYQENKKKNTLKINESDIKKMIIECIKKIKKRKP